MNKEEHKLYMREYRKKHPDKIKEADKKYRESDKRKEYLKEYNKKEKAKAYSKRWRELNKERFKEYNLRYSKTPASKIREKRYASSIKGFFNKIKKVDRKRFGKVELTLENLKEITERDKCCVYCKKDFGNLKNNKPTHDHLNPWKPLSIINTVICCGECNSSKLNANVIEWCNFKKIEVPKIVLELLEKQKEE